MRGLVYLLCAITALLCGALLLRGFRHSRQRLLLWCCLFFFSLAIENAIVFVDLIIVPDIDLFAVRTFVALAGVLLLLVGFIFDVR